MTVSFRKNFSRSFLQTEIVDNQSSPSSIAQTSFFTLHLAGISTPSHVIKTEILYSPSSKYDFHVDVWTDQSGWQILFKEDFANTACHLSLQLKLGIAPIESTEVKNSVEQDERALVRAAVLILYGTELEESSFLRTQTENVVSSA